MYILEISAKLVNGQNRKYAPFRFSNSDFDVVHRKGELNVVPETLLTCVIVEKTKKDTLMQIRYKFENSLLYKFNCKNLRIGQTVLALILITMLYSKIDKCL